MPKTSTKNRQDLVPARKLVPARDIPPGRCFRKRGGRFAYLRFSDSVARRFNQTKNIHGVSHTGNTTSVRPDCMVEPVSHSVMAENAAHDVPAGDGKPSRPDSDYRQGYADGLVAATAASASALARLACEGSSSR